MNKLDAGRSFRFHLFCQSRYAHGHAPPRTDRERLSFDGVGAHNEVYGIAKAATDKMSVDMAHELRDCRVRVDSRYPGLVRTEAAPPGGQGGVIRYFQHQVSGVTDPVLFEENGLVKYLWTFSTS
jgi:hypothetical protein